MSNRLTTPTFQTGGTYRTPHTDTGRMVDEVGRLHGHLQALVRATVRSGKIDKQTEANIRHASKVMQDRVLRQLAEVEARLLQEMMGVKAKVEIEVARARAQVQADMEMATFDFLRTVAGGRRDADTDLQDAAAAVERSGIALHHSMATRQEDHPTPSMLGRFISNAGQVWTGTQAPPRYESAASSAMAANQADVPLIGSALAGTGEIEDDNASDIPSADEGRRE
ncbi:hypothetical protein OC835_005408 [Tilletia horrida]|nr:hypothetical protein OC835_005408 [Tilletia horrida]